MKYIMPLFGLILLSMPFSRALACKMDSVSGINIHSESCKVRIVKPIKNQIIFLQYKYSENDLKDVIKEMTSVKKNLNSDVMLQKKGRGYRMFVGPVLSDDISMYASKLVGLGYKEVLIKRLQENATTTLPNDRIVSANTWSQVQAVLPKKKQKPVTVVEEKEGIASMKVPSTKEQSSSSSSSSMVKRASNDNEQDVLFKSLGIMDKRVLLVAMKGASSLKRLSYNKANRACMALENDSRIAHSNEYVALLSSPQIISALEDGFATPFWLDESNVVTRYQQYIDKRPNSPGVDYNVICSVSKMNLSD